MAHLEDLQINDTLAQLRPTNVLDNGITNEEGVDQVNTHVEPNQPKKAKAKSKEAKLSVSYFKLFRFGF